MRAGILLSMLGRKAGGLESYERGLLLGLAQLDRENQYEIFCLSRQTVDCAPLAQSNFRFRLLWPSNRWISLPAILPFELAVRRVEVLHATFFLPPFCPTPTVFTVHDLGMFSNPEFYHPALRWRINRLIAAGIRKANVVLCISRSIRDLVKEQFKIPEERLAIVYHGVSTKFQPQSSDLIKVVTQRYGLRPPYFLFVGQLRPGIKNLARLIKAHYRFRMESKLDIQLVLAGRRPHPRRYPTNELDESLLRFGEGGHVREVGYIADEDLPAIYSGAEGLVFPSLCEGFGLPVLEAMACGTPVLTSNIDTLKEISGGAALLVDPFSEEEIAAGMHDLICNPALRQELRLKGLARASEFTWLRTAEQSLAAYRLAAEASPRRIRSGAMVRG